MASKKQDDGAAEKSDLVEARVLVRCKYGEPNDVVTVAAAEAEASTELDSSEDAVAAAKAEVSGE